MIELGADLLNIFGSGREFDFGGKTRNDPTALFVPLLVKWVRKFQYIPRKPTNKQLKAVCW